MLAGERLAARREIRYLARKSGKFKPDQKLLTRINRLENRLQASVQKRNRRKENFPDCGSMKNCRFLPKKTKLFRLLPNIGLLWCPVRRVPARPPNYRNFAWQPAEGSTASSDAPSREELPPRRLPAASLKSWDRSPAMPLVIKSFQRPHRRGCLYKNDDRRHPAG